jgi:hypothetical protein
LGKLGQGFTSVDPLVEVDIGDDTIPRPTFVNKNIDPMFKLELIKILKEYVFFEPRTVGQSPPAKRNYIKGEGKQLLTTAQLEVRRRRKRPKKAYKTKIKQLQGLQPEQDGRMKTCFDPNEMF